MFYLLLLLFSFFLKELIISIYFIFFLVYLALYIFLG